MLKIHFLKTCICPISAVTLLTASSAIAAVFDGTPRTVTVGSAGAPTYDFATLGAAATDFNAVAAGINGNWIIEIQDNLTEPANVGFQNAMNPGATVVVKPKAGTQPVVTFTATATNAGHGGHLIIGGVPTGPTVAATSNFTIDGSNGNTADGTRDLTIQNVAASPTGTNKLIVVTGNSTNVAIKNSMVKNVSTIGTPYGVIWKMWRSTSTYSYPNNGLIENCDIQCSAVNTGRAIGTVVGGSGGTSLNTGITGWVIRNNNVVGGNRAIGFEADVGGCEIYNNMLTVNCTAANLNSRGITHDGADGAAVSTISIHDNVLTATTAAATAGGVVMMDLTPTSNLPPTSAVYNIYNNFIGGITFTAAAGSANLSYIGIRANYAATTMRCYFNSIHLKSQPVLGGATSANCFGIGHVAASFPSIDWKNNIIRVDQSGGACLAKASASTANFSSNYNDLSPVAGAYTGVHATLNQTSLTDWQTASSQDSNSIAVDPTSQWVSPATGDLHFAAQPSATFNGTPITSPVNITQDIDGQTRNSTAPTIGADEFAVAAAVGDWFVY